MQIQNHVLQALEGLPIVITKDSIEQEKQWNNSPLNNIIKVPLDGSEQTMCEFCPLQNTNWCWNCEKPHCDRHGKALFAAGLILTLCLECAQELTKHGRVVLPNASKRVYNEKTD